MMQATATDNHVQLTCKDEQIDQLQKRIETLVLKIVRDPARLAVLRTE